MAPKPALTDVLKQHRLPDVTQWLDVDDEATIRDIRLAFQDKLSLFIDITADVLRPEKLSAMNEAQVFSEAEHDAIEKLANTLMLLGKDCTLVSIQGSEADELALIKRLCEEWPAFVTELKRIVERTKDAYRNNATASHPVSYLG